MSKYIINTILKNNNVKVYNKYEHLCNLRKNNNTDTFWAIFLVISFLELHIQVVGFTLNGAQDNLWC